MDFTQRIRNSWEFIVNCFRFLYRNPGLVILPLISLIVVILVIISLVFASILDIKQLSHFFQNNKVLFFASLLILYFVMSFIIIFFNAALITCVINRLQGKNASIGHAMWLTLQKIGPLLQWTLLSSTICLLINAMERAHSVIADIISAIFGFSWAITTYFVLPIMVTENVGPVKAFKRSIALIGKGWRKLLSVNAIFFLILLAIFGLFYLAAMLLQQTGYAVKINGEVAGIAMLLLFVLWIIINTAFNSIFNSALYLTISGQKLLGFDQELVTQLIEKK